MKKAYFVFVLLLSAVVACSQNVAHVNNEPISAREFMWVYKKNHNGSGVATFEELTSYLELYINFKLKVLDAKAEKMDRDTAYINEIKRFEQLIKSNHNVGRSKAEQAYIINEYRDGVLMFNISEKKVWNPTRSAAGLVTEKEQQSLEKQWLSQLKEKYRVVIHEEALKKIARL